MQNTFLLSNDGKGVFIAGFVKSCNKNGANFVTTTDLVRRYGTKCNQKHKKKLNEEIRFRFWLSEVN